MRQPAANPFLIAVGALFLVQFLRLRQTFAKWLPLAMSTLQAKQLTRRAPPPPPPTPFALSSPLLPQKQCSRPANPLPRFSLPHCFNASLFTSSLTSVHCRLSSVYCL